MADCMNTVSEFDEVREAVCVSVRKIMDACRDQDCMENVPVYLTAESQETLEQAASVRGRSAELLLAEVEVEPAQYRDGYYCVHVRYYYRVLCDATICGVRPVTIYGLALADRSCTLYGGEGQAAAFRSDGIPASEPPTGVVEAVNPMVLCAGIAAPGEESVCPVGDLPEAVAAAFDDELIFTPGERQLQVSLGQFSLVRLERETQLLIPSYNYCMPEKACSDGSCGCPEDPCEAFSRMEFPVSAFFPVAEGTPLCGSAGDAGEEPEPEAPAGPPARADRRR